MNPGPWHQCGDKSQRLVIEQLEKNAGVGVILSPKDLSHDKAIEYTQRYHDLGAAVLCDQQFYIPDYSNERLESYDLSPYRVAISRLNQLNDSDLANIATHLKSISTDLQVDAIVSPAVLYEAGRPDILRLNERLLAITRDVGQALGKPTYATVVLARSATASDQTLTPILSHVTGLACDGWYFGFEFEPERVPSSRPAILRCCNTGLTLACTGKPVLHAYAGFLAPLSLAFGATGAAVGHSQNLWKFTPERWQTLTTQGGGGDAPARFFSKTLWGTIIAPDELVQLPPSLRERVLTSTPFSGALTLTPSQSWSRWEANKHLVHLLCKTIEEMVGLHNAIDCITYAKNLLDSSVALHTAIRSSGLILGDRTNMYQANWSDALSDLLRDRESDYEYLKLLS